MRYVMSKRPQRLSDGTAREPLNAKTKQTIKAAVSTIADEDGRTFSNTVEHLLEESPRVKRKLKELAAV
jgi:protein-disulfide isomerase-like protein with CxxC motif